MTVTLTCRLYTTLLNTTLLQVMVLRIPRPLVTVLQADAAEDGPNLLVRGGPAVLGAFVALGVWLALRGRRR